MNKKNRTLFCSALFAFFINSSTLLASSDTDRQTLSIKIPKVALIELDKTEHTFIFSNDTQTLSHTSQVAISSNDQNARINVRVDGLPSNIELKIAANARVCVDEPAQNASTFSCRVGMKAIRDGKLVLTASRVSQKVIPNGRYTANITFTLGD